MRIRHLAVTMAISLAMIAGATAADAAPSKTPAQSVTWTGNGTSVVDGTRTLGTSVCGIANGAPVDGNYLLFVLASTKNIDTASIKFGSDDAVAMSKSNLTKNGTSSYKYRYEGTKTLAELLELPVVASYNGSGTPTLTVSHGCQEPAAANVAGLFYRSGEGEIWLGVTPTYYGTWAPFSGIPNFDPSVNTTAEVWYAGAIVASLTCDTTTLSDGHITCTVVFGDLRTAGRDPGYYALVQYGGTTYRFEDQSFYGI